MVRTINFFANGFTAQSSMLQLGYIVKPYHLVLCSLAFAITILLLIIYVSFYLSKRKKAQALKERLRIQYSDIVGYIITAETEEELNAIINARRGALQQWLTHKFARKIFIDELYRATKMISGEALSNVVWVYNHFDLQKDTEQNLQSKYWNIVAKAIQRLAALNQEQLIVRIYRFTNSTNDHIREQAQAATVKLTGFKGLRFLDITDKPITKWQQLCLLNELSFHTGYDETRLKKWLQSSNKSVIAFALMLVKTYRCYQLHDDVIACLQHADVSVKEHAIVTLTEIAEPSTSALLINCFQNNEDCIQLEILNALQFIGDVDDIPFLETILQHEKNDFKLAAAKAIKSIRSNDGLESIKMLVPSLENPWPKILAQLEEERA